MNTESDKVQNFITDEKIENLINKKLKIVAQENTMLNHNFIMKFRILEKINSLKETYINTIIPYVTPESALHFINTIEFKKINYEDLLYDDKNCDMSFLQVGFMKMMAK